MDLKKMFIASGVIASLPVIYIVGWSIQDYAKFRARYKNYHKVIAHEYGAVLEYLQSNDDVDYETFMSMVQEANEVIKTAKDYYDIA